LRNDRQVAEQRSLRLLGGLAEDLRVLFQASSVTPYEDTVVEDATMSDLDDEVITTYRRSLIEANPATELRDATLEELVQSLGGAKRSNGMMKPTVAGVLLFGKRLSLRRLFPAARVDYVRVPGTEKFDTDQFQLLLVANKYQTGFDQPLLHTMYVDKRLSGVQAVQTLSRLNRTTPGKEDTFVLDFVNDADEIQRSFQPYYEQTVVAESADPHQLYELQHRLEALQVTHEGNVMTLLQAGSDTLLGDHDAL
jgi:hypothetical protein